MGFNLRRFLSGKKDLDLTLIHSRSQNDVWEADREYRQGGTTAELATRASRAAEVVTVSAAIIKERIESGGAGSHLSLQDGDVQPSPKRVDRGWGAWLGERRRV